MGKDNEVINAMTTRNSSKSMAKGGSSRTSGKDVDMHVPEYDQLSQQKIEDLMRQVSAKAIAEVEKKFEVRFEALKSENSQLRERVQAMDQRLADEHEQQRQRIQELQQMVQDNHVDHMKSLEDRYVACKSSMAVINNEVKAIKETQDLISDSYMRASELSKAVADVKVLGEQVKGLQKWQQQQQHQNKSTKVMGVADAVKIAKAAKAVEEVEHKVTLRCTSGNAGGNMQAVESSIEKVAAELGFQLHIKQVAEMASRKASSKTAVVDQKDKGKNTGSGGGSKSDAGSSSSSKSNGTNKNTDGNTGSKGVLYVVDFADKGEAERFLAAKRKLPAGMFADSFLTYEEMQQRRKLSPLKQFLKVNKLTAVWRRAELFQYNTEWKKGSRAPRWIPVPQDVLDQARIALETEPAQVSG